VLVPVSTLPKVGAGPLAAIRIGGRVESVVPPEGAPLGSVSGDLVRESSAPVLVVPDGAGEPPATAGA
jgi:hypothetical protein